MHQLHELLMSLQPERIIDCTHTIHPDMPTWTGSQGFTADIKMDYHQGCRVMKYHMHAGIGTHIDAPSHFIKDAPSVADIQLDQLIAPAIVIPCTGESNERKLSVHDIETFEHNHGTIPSKSIALINTEWASRWDNPESYRNKDNDGAMHFPGVSPEAAQLLLTRGVNGIGIDTLSPDGSPDTFPVHDIMLGAGKYILENVANLDQLPPTGAIALIMPLRIHSGTESPVRICAILPITT